MKKIVIVSCLCMVALHSFTQTANLFSKFENGDIISSANGTTRTQLDLCSTASNHQIIGVFNKSERELQIEKDNQDIAFNPIKTRGFVDVKYNTENGPIKKGDPITSSSVKGEGMKATKSGLILGIALEDASDASGLVKVRIMIQYLKQ